MNLQGTELSLMMQRMARIMHIGDGDKDFNNLPECLKQHIVKSFVDAYQSLTNRQKELIDWRVMTKKDMQDIAIEMGVQHYSKALYRLNRRAFMSLKIKMMRKMSPEVVRKVLSDGGYDVTGDINISSDGFDKWIKE
jgi:hypothetical protein